MTCWLDYSFQDSMSLGCQFIYSFFDHVMIMVLFIVSLIFMIMVWNTTEKGTNRFLYKNEWLEIIWTLIPFLVLVSIAFPSLSVLYYLDEVTEPSVTVKVVGHQWYWSYEYTDFKDVSFSSYLLNSNPAFRLLETDNNVVLPMMEEVRFIVTSADVIHSWTVPSMGVKVDGVPGRLNQIHFTASHLGLAFGQCSEICGAFHSFMPISVEIIPKMNFLNWLLNFN